MKNHPFKHMNMTHGRLRNMMLMYLFISVTVVLSSCSKSISDFEESDNHAQIFPGYYDLTIPPNIAPLNFVIKEPGTRFRVEISAGDHNSFEVSQRSPNIKIPIARWSEMLAENAGNTLYLDIWSLNNKQWIKYKRIKHHIATEPIDPYMAYRLVHAVYLKWQKMGIYQRNMTNFNESPVIENSSTGNGCMNCHTFANNDPSRMLIHFRILHPGTMIWNDDTLSKIDTKTPGTLSAGIYAAWHPNGKYIAFSTGKISPHLTTRLDKVVDVADRESDLMVYDVENNQVITPPALATKRRENMPVWSPDGKHLYYLSAPEAIAGNDESLLHARYDLMRISCSPGLKSWGETEMVLSSDSTGKSISMPAISPDGKYLICSMSDFGYFTIFHKESDLYCIDLGTQNYKKLELNSGSAESHSAWSSNGRWLVFSSKRLDDVFSRPHIAYFDENGVAHNPFVLPQKDPEMYDRLLANYNLPRLITGKIELSPTEIRDMVLTDPEQVNPNK